ncbi:Superoxide dismutase 1 copper chaperone [Smittium mucronatum]|uniref:Superoxide dismutase 1 copper chaperone n=1 Tax=Smittium mucronatum TaxID=133383 RepID=A0A1R0GZX2_9FUNG|nr:Superoxide dismutase 1 copper chaperone [Smittium mucronatum]
MTNEITVEYAVEMTCKDCTTDIEAALSSIKGIDSSKFDLERETVILKGTFQPSLVVEKLYSIGKTAIIRGAGTNGVQNTGDGLGAAVCILENYTKVGKYPEGSTMGLIRLIQVQDDVCYMDVSISDVPSGDYIISPRQNGDLSNVPSSNGKEFKFGHSQNESQKPIVVNINESGAGKLWLDCIGWKIYEIIGRSILVSKINHSKVDYASSPILSGIVARSSGVFENDKTVCSCSGKTLWEESKMMRQKA